MRTVFRCLAIAVTFVLALALPGFAGQLDDYYLAAFGAQPVSAPEKTVFSTVTGPTVAVRSGTPLRHGLKKDWLNLQPTTRKTLAKYLALPTLSGTEQVLVSSGGHFKVHYTSSGTDAPNITAINRYTGLGLSGIGDWVTQVADRFEDAYSFYVGLGYHPPANFPGTPFNVYLHSLTSQGAYAFTESDQPAASAGFPYAFTSYIEMDKDFTGSIYQPAVYDPLQNLQITSAHEFHHAIQYGYNYYFDIWYAEVTSTWFENELYPAVKQLYDYLPGWLGNSTRAIDLPQSDPAFNSQAYGRWLLNRSLAEDHTASVVRSFWEKTAEIAPPADLSDIPMAPVLDSVLAASYGSTLGADFFGLTKRIYRGDWTTHTEDVGRIVYAPVQTFSSYPVNAGTAANSATLPHYSFAFYKFTPSATTGNLTISLAKTSGIRTAVFKKAGGTVSEIAADSGGSYSVGGFGALKTTGDEVVLLVANTTNVDGHGVNFSTDGSTAQVQEPGTAGAPGGVSATAGNASATVSFTAPLSGGNSPITGYTVTASPGGNTGTGTASPVTVTGLDNGTAYTFTVAATNGAGVGLASSVSNSVTPADTKTLTVNISGAGNGTVAISTSAATCSSYPCTDREPSGTALTLTASPAAGSVLTGWSAPFAVTSYTANVAGFKGFTTDLSLGPDGNLYLGEAANHDNIPPRLLRFDGSGLQSVYTDSDYNNNGISWLTFAGNSLYFTQNDSWYGNSAISKVSFPEFGNRTTMVTSGSLASVYLFQQLKAGNRLYFTSNDWGSSSDSTAPLHYLSLTDGTVTTVTSSSAAQGNPSVLIDAYLPGQSGGSANDGYLFWGSGTGSAYAVHRYDESTGAMISADIGAVSAQRALGDTVYLLKDDNLLYKWGRTDTAPARLSAVPFPGAGQGSVVLADGNRIYAMSATASNALYAFDPGTGGWSKLADLPEAVNAGSVVKRGDKLYLASTAALYELSPSCAGSSASCVVVLSADTSVTANFALAPNSYTITAVTTAGGTISPATPLRVNYGETISFAVTPEGGYKTNTVTGCGGALVGTTYTTGAITADCTVTANFSPSVVVSVPGKPTVTAVAGNQSATVTVSVADNGGATITGYGVTATDLTSGTGTTTQSAASPVTVTGLTNGHGYTFTATATNSAGTSPPSDPSDPVTPQALAPALSAPSAALVKSGATVIYTVSYVGAESITLSAGDVTVNKTGTASGTAAVSGSGTATRTVTISGIGGDGTLGIGIGPGTASAAGGAIQAQATPPSAAFTVDNTAPSLSVGYPAGDLATAQSSIVLTGTANDALSGVMLSISHDGTTYAPVIANGGFSQLLTFGTANRSYPVTVTATDAAGNSTSITRNVTFSPHSVAFTTGGGGTVSGTLSQQVGDGDNATAVTAVPASGYQFVDWTDAAGLATSANPLTLTNVRGDRSVTANFARPPVTTASPAGGTYNGVQIVRLNSNVTGSTIYYSIDGSTPEPGAGTTRLYTVPFPVGATISLRYFAVSPQGLNEAVKTQSYLISPLPITTASPAGGSYAAGVWGQTVTLAASVEGATIYYTTDGSTPDVSDTTGATRSAVTSAAIAIPAGGSTATTVVKYFAKDPVTGNRESMKSQSYTITVAPPVPTVTASPAGGLYNRAQTITLSSGGSGAAIYYTTDGSTPGQSPATVTYGGSIPIAANTVLKYYAVVTGAEPSTVRSQTYIIDTVVPATTAAPGGGTYGSSLRIALSSSKAATIYYTTDGTNPTWPATGATQTYFGPIDLAQSAVLKYFSRDAVGNTEAVRTQSYVVNPAALSTGAKPPGGLYNTAQLVLLSTGVTGATIRYTTDGSDPTGSAGAAVFNGTPIGIVSTTVLKYSALDSAGSSEPVRSQTYSINAVPPAVVSTWPADGDDKVALDTAVTVTFSKPIAVETLPPAKSLMGVSASGSLSADGTVWTVIPSAPLAYGSSYGYTLSGVKDPWGNPLPDTTRTFSTLAKPVKTIVSSLSLGVSSNAVISGKPVTVNGVFSSTGASTAGLTVSLSLTGPDGGVAGIAANTDANGAFNTDLPAAMVLQPGRYQLQAFAGSVDGMLAPVSSTPVTLRVLPVAGYAVMVLGRISSGEGEAEHLKSFTRAYNALIARGFDPGNIKTVKADDTAFNMQEVSDAVTVWARDMLNRQPAPLQIILVDHGSPDTFYMEDKIITSEMLAGWMAALEQGLTPAALAQERYVVIGSCDSGSYVNDLAAPGRIVITSTDVGEESFRGPVETDHIRGGEYFIDRFYAYLQAGQSIRDSFNNAAADVAAYTRQGGIASSSGDTPLQNPLASINGAAGVHQIPAGSEDEAPDTLYLGTGGNAAFDPTGMLPVEPKAAVTAVFLGGATTSYTFSVPGSPDMRAWLEVRAPSLKPQQLSSDDQPTADGAQIQLIAALPQVRMTYDNASGSFQGTYTGFTEAGSYDIDIYLQDALALQGPTARHLTLYKNRAGNSAPLPFNLTSPTDRSRQASSLTFGWDLADDPDGDVVTYTLLIGRNQDLSAPSVVKEGLSDPFAVVGYDDGLLDLADYYWQVWAIDSYGAITRSPVRGFNTDNTNGGISVVMGKVTDAASGAGIAGAKVSVRGVNTTTFANGSYLLLLSPGSFALGVTATGYKPALFSGLIATSMGVTSKSINLDALATTFKITASVNDSNMGYLNCPATVVSGNSVSCTVQPLVGYRVVGVSGTCGGSAPAGSVYTTGALSADCTVSASFEPQPAPNMPGDYNKDGVVDISEVQSAINIFLGLKAVNSSVDRSGDGTVSISELQKVIDGFLVN